jgi:hypothetical protein
MQLSAALTIQPAATLAVETANHHAEQFAAQRARQYQSI